ncbi:tetratricopeptide repeat protein [Nocardia sp. NPDC059240]|uniref:tetratricopeptide repeat protein n=1 Tax=Nocardia sp. NPDC059240 TaxID=3346786 RepID=UPI00367BE87A
MIDRELGDRTGEAERLADLGNMRARTGDYGGAADLQYAVVANRKIGSRIGEAYALSNLSTLREKTGGYTEAADLQQQALAIYREIGSRPGEALVLNRLGRLLISADELHSAWRTYTDALDVAYDTDFFLHTRVLEGATYCLASLGDTDKARTQLREAIAMYRRIGVPESPTATAKHTMPPSHLTD